MADRVAHVLIALAVAVLAALVGLGGLGFLAAALYQLLATVVPAAAAAAITGVLGLLLMVILFWLSRLVLRPVTRRPAPRPDGNGDGERDPVGLLVDRIRPLLRGRASEATAFAFGAGIVLGVSPRARRAVWSGIRTMLDGTR